MANTTGQEDKKDDDEFYKKGTVEVNTDFISITSGAKKWEYHLGSVGSVVVGIESLTWAGELIETLLGHHTHLAVAVETELGATAHFITKVKETHLWASNDEIGAIENNIKSVATGVVAVANAVKGLESKANGSTNAVSGNDNKISGITTEVKGDTNEIQGNLIEVNGNNINTTGMKTEVVGNNVENVGSKTEVVGAQTEVLGPHSSVSAVATKLSSLFSIV